MILLSIAEKFFFCVYQIKKIYQLIKYRFLKKDILLYISYSTNNSDIFINHSYNYDIWYYVLIFIICKIFFPFIKISALKKINKLNLMKNEIIVTHFVINGELKKLIFDQWGYDNLIKNFNFSSFNNFLYVNVHELNSNIVNIDVTSKFHCYNSSFYLGSQILCKHWMDILTPQKKIDLCKIDIIRDTDFAIQTFKENDIIFFNNE